jgi:hypothetical protein
VCAPGVQSSNWKEYLSIWGKVLNNKGNTLENRKECWDLAKHNVPFAIGILFFYGHPFCRAIVDASSLMPWPASFPDLQDTANLCILQSYIQSGNFKYNRILF